MLEWGQAVAGLVKLWVSYLERQHQASGQTPHPSTSAPSHLDREPWLSHGKELLKTLVAWDAFQPLLTDRILIHGLVFFVCLFLCFCFQRVNVSGSPGWPKTGYVVETDPKMNLWSSSVSAGLTGMHHHTPGCHGCLLASKHSPAWLQLWPGNSGLKFVKHFDPTPHSTERTGPSHSLWSQRHSLSL